VVLQEDEEPLLEDEALDHIKIADEDVAGKATERGLLVGLVGRPLDDLEGDVGLLLHKDVAEPRADRADGWAKERAVLDHIDDLPLLLNGHIIADNQLADVRDEAEVLVEPLLLQYYLEALTIEDDLVFELHELLLVTDLSRLVHALLHVFRVLDVFPHLASTCAHLAVLLRGSNDLVAHLVEYHRQLREDLLLGEFVDLDQLRLVVHID